ncbi:histone-lysine N-methyltransferase set1-like [Aphidius gifuensis]|uniref:histone-lysine N-methyltransferase set1-like n=1 Tax=Aphidius gifuensis TaxID=684658 RepID=UPI001CDC6EDB|nr:histone-lysine N-methyltransferase set1-like [Aphidius gifuensis]
MVDEIKKIDSSLCNNLNLNINKQKNCHEITDSIDEELSTDSGCSSSESAERFSKNRNNHHHHHHHYYHHYHHHHHHHHDDNNDDDKKLDDSSDSSNGASIKNEQQQQHQHHLNVTKNKPTKTRSQERLSRLSFNNNLHQRCAGRVVAPKASRSWSPSKSRKTNDPRRTTTTTTTSSATEASASTTTTTLNTQSDESCSDSSKKHLKVDILKRALHYLGITASVATSSSSTSSSIHSSSGGGSNSSNSGSNNSISHFSSNSSRSNSSNNIGKEKKLTKKSPKRILREPVSYIYVKGPSGLPTQRVPRNQNIH